MKAEHTHKRVDRRRFLGAAASSVATCVIVPRHVLGGRNFVAPSDKVNVAIVGAGGQGRTNARALFEHADAQIIAVADPNEHEDYSRFYYKGVAGRKPVKAEIEKHYSQKTPNHHVAEFEDFRVMLEQEKDIDAILCATPDHVHAYVSIVAMRAGKHVYCEKPLTHNVWEARQVAKVAEEAGVATQMGNQGHSGEGIRATCEWIWDGAIGTIREVHAWSDIRSTVGAGRPKETPPIKNGLNWDLWLGPRDERPYHPGYAPFDWRGWWAFGGGTLGDMACHNLDPAVWALDLKDPVRIEGNVPDDVDSERTPYCGVYHYEFGQRGKHPPVKVTWYDGGLRPNTPIDVPDRKLLGEDNNGIMFLGDEGVICCGGWGGAPTIFPASKMESYKRPTKTLRRSKGHHRDWLDACKGGEPASSEFGYAGRLTEIVLLGNVALRAGQRIEWDGTNLRAKNTPEADRFIKESMRSGWEIG